MIADRAFADRALAAAGGLAGLLGVALSAVAAHVTGASTLDIAARFLLVHAVALLALAALAAGGTLHPLTARLAGLALGVGLTLFSGDLAWRALVGTAPIPSAAPVGGTILIGGWALVIAAALIGRRPARIEPGRPTAPT